MQIEFSHGLLRPWKWEDRGAGAQANNPPNCQNLRDAFPHPYTADDADRWLTVANKYDPPRNFAVVVEGTAGAGSVWCCATMFIAARPKSAIGWAKRSGGGDHDRGRAGDGRLRLHNFDLCRIVRRRLRRQHRERRVLEKAGFTFEARLRRRSPKGAAHATN